MMRLRYNAERLQPGPLSSEIAAVPTCNNYRIHPSWTII